jgi:hypothetical protein
LRANIPIVCITADVNVKHSGNSHVTYEAAAVLPVMPVLLLLLLLRPKDQGLPTSITTTSAIAPL